MSWFGACFCSRSCSGQRWSWRGWHCRRCRRRCIQRDAQKAWLEMPNKTMKNYAKCSCFPNCWPSEIGFTNMSCPPSLPSLETLCTSLRHLERLNWCRKPMDPRCPKTACQKLPSNLINLMDIRRSHVICMCSFIYYIYIHLPYESY